MSKKQSNIFFSIIKYVIFIAVILIISLMIYDQVALDLGHEYGFKSIGLLKLLGLEKAFLNLDDKYLKTGYYLVFYGSSFLFVFLVIAWVLSKIPLIGKILIFLLAIIPTISVILIVVGSLFLTNIFPL